MSESAASSIILDIIKIIFGFILGIILRPLSNFINKTEINYCAFKHPDVFEDRTAREIIVVKKFNKTVKINCPWFTRREEKIYKDKKYLHCPFGKNIDSNYSEKGGVCPFA